MKLFRHTLRRSKKAFTSSLLPKRTYLSFGDEDKDDRFATELKNLYPGTGASEDIEENERISRILFRSGYNQGKLPEFMIAFLKLENFNWDKTPNEKQDQRLHELGIPDEIIYQFVPYIAEIHPEDPIQWYRYMGYYFLNMCQTHYKIKDGTIYFGGIELHKYTSFANKLCCATPALCGERGTRLVHLSSKLDGSLISGFHLDVERKTVQYSAFGEFPEYEARKEQDYYADVLAKATGL